MLLLCVLCLTSSCLGPRLDNGERLINHPQFEAATLAAPLWVQEALDTVAELELQIEAED